MVNEHSFRRAREGLYARLFHAGKDYNKDCVTTGLYNGMRYEKMTDYLTRDSFELPTGRMSRQGSLEIRWAHTGVEV